MTFLPDLRTGRPGGEKFERGSWGPFTVKSASVAHKFAGHDKFRHHDKFADHNMVWWLARLTDAATAVPGPPTVTTGRDYQP